MWSAPVRHLSRPEDPDKDVETFSKQNFLVFPILISTLTNSVENNFENGLYDNGIVLNI